MPDRRSFDWYSYRGPGLAWSRTSVANDRNQLDRDNEAQITDYQRRLVSLSGRLSFRLRLAYWTFR